MLGCLFCWAMATTLLCFADKCEYFNGLTHEFQIMAAIGFIFVGSISRAASSCDDFTNTFKSIFKNMKLSVDKDDDIN